MPTAVLKFYWPLWFSSDQKMGVFWSVENKSGHQKTKVVSRILQLIHCLPSNKWNSRHTNEWGWCIKWLKYQQSCLLQCLLMLLLAWISACEVAKNLLFGLPTFSTKSGQMNYLTVPLPPPVVYLASCGRANINLLSILAKTKTFWLLSVSRQLFTLICKQKVRAPPCWALSSIDF